MRNHIFHFDTNAFKPERLFNTIYQDYHITVIAQKRSNLFQMLCFIIQKKTRTSLGQVHRSFLTDSWNCGFLKVKNTRLKPQCFLSKDVSSIIIICWVGFSNNLHVYSLVFIWKRNIHIKIKSTLADNQSELNGSLETPAYNKICKRVLRPLIEIWKSSLPVRHEISLNDYLIQMIWRSY